jgi:hypothetical protein
MQAMAEVLLRKPPAWDAGAKGAVDFYYWYYGTHAMRRVGGTMWDQWSQRVVAAVVSKQRSDGSFAGSWDPEDAWGQDGGRVYSTAILGLTLEACSR